jgi:hypothetical protein
MRFRFETIAGCFPMRNDLHYWTRQSGTSHLPWFSLLSMLSLLDFWFNYRSCQAQSCHCPKPRSELSQLVAVIELHPLLVWWIQECEVCQRSLASLNSKPTANPCLAWSHRCGLRSNHVLSSCWICGSLYRSDRCFHSRGCFTSRTAQSQGRLLSFKGYLSSLVDSKSLTPCSQTPQLFSQPTWSTKDS